MNNRLKQAFDQVQASEALKRSARHAVRAGMRRRSAPIRRAAAACSLMLCVGGPWLYLTPTAAISIDVNPSLALHVNRFDRVLSVQAYNDGGEALRNALPLRHRNCADAVDAILRAEPVAQALDAGGEMSIAVVGGGRAQAGRLLANMQSRTVGRGNAACYAAGRDEAEAAQAMGLSCGRYRALMQAQKTHPELTAEDARAMSMRELLALSGEAQMGRGNGHGRQGGRK